MTETAQDTEKPDSTRRSKKVPLASTAPRILNSMYSAADGMPVWEVDLPVGAEVPSTANTENNPGKSLSEFLKLGHGASIGVLHRVKTLELLSSPHAIMPSPRKQLRVPGEVALFKRVMELWGLDDLHAASLLGYDKPHAVDQLYAGIRGLASRDEKDRVRAVLRIATDLRALFRDDVEIRTWLREPKTRLAGASAIDLMMEGSMENLLRVKQLVELLSGR